MTARISAVGRTGDAWPAGVDDRVLGHRLVEEVLRERQEDRPRATGQRLAGRLGHRPRRPRPRCAARRPTWRDGRATRPGRSPGTPRGRGTRARSDRPRRTSASNPGGPCGSRWPGSTRRRRASRGQIAGRPVSWPCASAMNAAGPSCRVAMTRIPASSRTSSSPRNDSPGTVKAYRTPAARSASAMNRPTVRGPASRRLGLRFGVGLGVPRARLASIGSRSSGRGLGDLGRRRLGLG